MQDDIKINTIKEGLQNLKNLKIWKFNLASYADPL